MDEEGTRRDPSTTAVSILIAAVTVVGALVGWRIAVAGGAAAAADSRGLNAALQRANAGATVSTYLSMNLSFFADYSQHLKRAILLERDAALDPDLTRASRLRDEATQERNLAATARAYVNWDYVTADPTPGQPYFDGDRFWAASWAEAETTQDLDPDPSFSAANRNRSRARALSAVAVALSAVLLLLTGAAVSRGRAACVLCRVAAPLFFLSGLAAVLLEVLL